MQEQMCIDIYIYTYVSSTCIQGKSAANTFIYIYTYMYICLLDSSCTDMSTVYMLGLLGHVGPGHPEALNPKPYA